MEIPIAIHSWPRSAVLYGIDDLTISTFELSDTTFNSSKYSPSNSTGPSVDGHIYLRCV